MPDPCPQREDEIGDFHKVRLWQFLPQMVLTTAAVVGLPFLVVTMLRGEGVVAGQISLLLVALVISFAVSTLGAAIWKTRPGSGDLLFGDLLIWGFLRRWRVDRRLSSAAGLLDLRGGDAAAGDHTPAQKAQLLEKLAAALEARDPYTHGHSRRVARHSTLIAKRMGLPAKEVARIRAAAAIHDVGKVETPRELLNKSGRLSDEEFELIKRHPVDGARMVAALEDEELTRFVRHHHERLDGRGYPDGLRGDEIPLGARIIAVADTFDAITSTRPYRAATSHKRALEVLRTESGTQLDPKAVEAFRSYYSGLRPLALWAVLVSLPQRLFSSLFDGLGTAVASASKATAAAALVAGTAALSAGGFVHPPASAETARRPVTVAAEPTADTGPQAWLRTGFQGQAVPGPRHVQKPAAERGPRRHTAAAFAAHGAPTSGAAGAAGDGPAAAAPSGSSVPAAAGGGTGTSGPAVGGGGQGPTGEAGHGHGGESTTAGDPPSGASGEAPAATGHPGSGSPPEQAAAPEHASGPPSTGLPEQAAAPEHAGPPPSAGPPEQTAAPEHPAPPESRGAAAAAPPPPHSAPAGAG